MSRTDIRRNKILNICKSLTFFSFGVFFISILFRIYCSNLISVKNEELKELHASREVLRKEISRLEFIDTELSSLSDVEKRALRIGFVEQSGALLSIDTKSHTPVAALSN